MPSTQQKRIGNRPEKETVTVQDSLADTWKVMKPFVHFSFKAIKLMARTLIFIVKHIPKPDEDHAKPKHDKIIRIKS